MILFLTICTKNRRELLANEQAHRLLLKCWEKADGWRVGNFVLLPDHIHLFCTRYSESVSLRNWVQYWKSLCSANWPTDDPKPLWQLGYWDTQVRDREWYRSRCAYMLENPVRHGLVSRAELWPYKGVMNVITWHD